jgi:hypothetical protein
MLIRSALGLGVRLAQPVDPISGLLSSSDELASAAMKLAAGRNADDVDDFDSGPVGQSGPSGKNGRIGPEPSREEKLLVNAVSQEQCGGNWTVEERRMATLENGVITYLVTRPDDLRSLGDSLPRLRYFFLKHWAYDVKIFIPGDALRERDQSASFKSSPTLEEVKAVVRKHLFDIDNWEIATFDVKFPKVISDDPDWQSKMNTCAQAKGTDYKHMNQFFTKIMYEHPALEKYRYYLRIDADFSFINYLPNDPFCMMAKTGRKFMWQTRKRIWMNECSQGMWEWFEQYREAHGLTPQDRVYWKPVLPQIVYVGYAGMGDLDFFRSEPVRRVADAFNEDGRVYLNRWSDQTYYPFVLALFENHTAVGDIGFDWGRHPTASWCHKCTVDLPFDPVTGRSGAELHAR